MQLKALVLVLVGVLVLHSCAAQEGPGRHAHKRQVRAPKGRALQATQHAGGNDEEHVRELRRAGWRGVDGGATGPQRPPPRRGTPRETTRRSSAYSVNGLPCPETVVDLTIADSGGDLYDSAWPNNRTYVLAPGTYAWTQQQDFFDYDSNGAGDLCIVADIPGTVTIKAPITRPPYYPPYYYGYLLNIGSYHSEQSVGFKDVMVVGGYLGWMFISMTSYVSGPGGSAYLENVVVTDFSSQFYGSTIYLNSGNAYVKNSSFINNKATSHGGAIDIVNDAVPCGGVIEGSVFQGNSAFQGGAINLHGADAFGPGCSLELIDCVFTDNVAFNGSDTYTDGTVGGLGGALYIRTGSSVHISGTFCAQRNLAQTLGGFAHIPAGASLSFDTPDTETVADNIPDDVHINAGGNVTSAGTAGSWTPLPNSFYMFATVQQCADNFTSGRSNTCDACNGAAWDLAACACGIDVAIILTALPPTTAAGSTLTYTVNMINDGTRDSPPTNGFTLQVPACLSVPDTLVPLPSPGSPDATCTVSRPLGAGAGSTLTCTIDGQTLLQGTAWSYQLPLDAIAACTANATATLTQPDANPANNADSVLATILACSTGKCCNADGTFKPSSTMCRPATSKCVRSAHCTGDSPNCPASINQPDGQACPFAVQSEKHNGRYHHDAMAATAGAHPTSADEGPDLASARFALASEAGDDAHATRRLQAASDPSELPTTSLLEPCRGECVAGKCLLVYPFRRPQGGCCRMLTLADFHRDDASDDEYTPKGLDRKVCWHPALADEAPEGYDERYEGHGGRWA